MDISKLSRHTKQAKKLIALALGLKKLEFKKTKRVTLDPEKPLETINSILGKPINKGKIKAKLVIRNICGSDGAAKKLSNSMLTKNKAGGGFKKLAEELEKIKYDESSYDSSLSEPLDEMTQSKIAETPENNEADLFKRLQGLETLLKTYINGKKRGALKENGKNAREIDWLKLLCALSVLAAINKLEKATGANAQEGEVKEEEKGAEEEVKKEEEEARYKRRKKYENITSNNKDALLNLAKQAPLEALDPPNIQVAAPLTGVYLWAKGYDVEKFLGSGSFGVVWACKSKKDPSGMKAMKVLAREHELQEAEIRSVKELKMVLENDKTGKAKKYLADIRIAKPTDPTGVVLKSALANSFRSFEQEQIENSKRKGEFFEFDHILDKAHQMLKGVKSLHDNGKVHSDIKIDNFLEAKTWEGKDEKREAVAKIKEILDNNQIPSAKDKVAKIKLVDIKDHKSLKKISDITSNTSLSDDQKVLAISEFIKTKKLRETRSQLTDFGTLTEANTAMWSVGDPKYICSSDIAIFSSNSLSKDQRINLLYKRDVYALGVTFMELLFGPTNYNDIVYIRNQIENQLQSRPDATDYYNSFNNFIPANPIEQAYGIDSKDKIILFLDLIKQMTKTDYTQRISLDKASDILKTIKSM